MTDYEPKGEWPETTPVNQARLLETVGWEALMMIAEGQFTIERDRNNEPVGLRVRLEGGWWVVVLGTVHGWSIGKFHDMVPYGWLHGVASADLTALLQRAAVTDAPWPPVDDQD